MKFLTASPDRGATLPSKFSYQPIILFPRDPPSLSTHINPKLTAPRTDSHLQPRPHQPLPPRSYRRRFRGVEVVAGRKGAAACGCTRRGRDFFDEEGWGSGEGGYGGGGGGFGVGGGHGSWAFGEGRGW